MLTIDSLLAVISLAFTAFGLGYAIGSNNKSQKITIQSANESGYFFTTNHQ